jgi:hypothetical protein
MASDELRDLFLLTTGNTERIIFYLQIYTNYYEFF